MVGSQNRYSGAKGAREATDDTRQRRRWNRAAAALTDLRWKKATGVVGQNWAKRRMA
jgi:hypothetical protein